MDAVLGRTCLYGSLKMDMIVRIGRVDRSQESGVRRDYSEALVLTEYEQDSGQRV